MNWDSFKNTLRNDFNNYSYYGELDLAKKLSKLYDNTIKTGFDNYNNYPIVTKPDILTSGFYRALMHAKGGKELRKVSKEIIGTVIIYWSLIVMSTTSLPPGSISVVSNKITFPGLPFEFPIYNTNNSDIFINNLVKYFELHLSQVKGLTIALVQVGSNTVPTNFPWTGIH